MAHRHRSAGEPVIRQEVDSGTAELIRDPDRLTGWTLLVNGTPQSHVDLTDPGYLAFEYVRRIGHVIDLAAPPGEPLRVVHLGGGGLTLARYVAATRPRSRQLAAEVDGALMDLVWSHLPLRRDARPRVRIADARQVLQTAPAGLADLVIADVFAVGRTPAHLTSVQFAAAAVRALNPAGVFTANVADGGRLEHARAQAATVCAAFPHVCLIAEAGTLHGRRFGNLVLAASRRGLPVAALTRRAAADPFPSRVVHGGDLTRFISGARAVTDADARPSPRAPADVFGIAAG